MHKLMNSIHERPQADRSPGVPPELEALAQLMDSIFRVPGSRIRFGMDALIGLIPGIGDLVTSFVSLYLLSAARQFGVPRVTLLRMALNVVIDLVLGAIPFIGDAFDLFWKANQRNLALLRKHAAATPLEARRLTFGDWLFVLLIFAVFLAIIVGAAMIAYYLIAFVFQALFPSAPQVALSL
jgi:hypothetical protein